MSAEIVEVVPLETAVLFLVFNRLDTTARVFESIRQARPPRLYVAADGPRPDRPSESEKCEQVRIIATAVDWACEVKTLFRDENLGCKLAVSGAITWFFEQEEQGIILEDDCLPHPDFFIFCEALLEKYKNDDRVFAITGDNFQNGQKRGEYSYYFSKYNHVWGWASWRRAWQYYDREITFWPRWRRSAEWRAVCPDAVERRYWEKIFDKMHAGEIDTWDYQWTASVWQHGGVTATPTVNLVTNIGFGSGATHTAEVGSAIAAMVVGRLGGLCYPMNVTQDGVADRYVFDRVFGGRSQRFPWLLLGLLRRAVKFIYRNFNNCR